MRITEQLIGEYVQNAKILMDEPMSNYTTFKIGGNADALIMPESQESIVQAINFCRNNQINYCILGYGSNVLVKDEGFRGIIIRLGENFNQIKFKGTTAIAQAGARLSVLSREVLQKKMAGLAFAGGIPGSVGGAVAMNAGAYEQSVGDVLKQVTYLDENQAVIVREVQPDDMRYRSSFFAEHEYVVLQAIFGLHYDTSGEERKRYDAYNKQRKEKQPLTFPSAGSVFKRPKNHFAGKLIEESGLKGLSVGGAEVSTLHAGFIINNGQATAADVTGLIEIIQKRVFENTGIMLQLEVKLIG